MKWRLQMQSFHHQMSSEDEWKNRQTFGFALHRRFHSINTVNTYMGRRIHPQIHWPKMKEKPYFTDAILIHSYCDSDRAKVNHLKKVHILKFCNNKFCNFEEFLIFFSSGLWAKKVKIFDVSNVTSFVQKKATAVASTRFHQLSL